MNAAQLFQLAKEAYPRFPNCSPSGETSDWQVGMQLNNVTRKTVIATDLEVADTGAKRNKGLLGRKGLPPGGGLWIVPCESVHTIGMQFAIDLIYLDRKYRVRKVRSAVPPWRLSACLTAHSILELPAGTIRDSQTRAGDLLEFSDGPASTQGRPDGSIDPEAPGH